MTKVVAADNHTSRTGPALVVVLPLDIKGTPNVGKVDGVTGKRRVHMAAEGCVFVGRAVEVHLAVFVGFTEGEGKVGGCGMLRQYQFVWTKMGIDLEGVYGSTEVNRGVLGCLVYGDG